MEHAPLSPPSPYTDTLCYLFIFFFFSVLTTVLPFPPLSLSLYGTLNPWLKAVRHGNTFAHCAPPLLCR